MIIKLCENCGAEFVTQPYKLRLGFGRFCSRKCRSCFDRVKGDRTIHTDGYILLRVPNHPRANLYGGFVYEHILVAESNLGRSLLPGEIVHHVNGDPADNRFENLQVMTQAKHGAMHMRERAVVDGVADPINFKRCARCKEIKRRTGFSTYGPGRTSAYCRPCCVIMQRERRARVA